MKRSAMKNLVQGRLRKGSQVYGTTRFFAVLRMTPLSCNYFILTIYYTTILRCKKSSWKKELNLKQYLDTEEADEHLITAE